MFATVTAAKANNYEGREQYKDTRDPDELQSRVMIEMGTKFSIDSVVLLMNGAAPYSSSVRLLCIYQNPSIPN